MRGGQCGTSGLFGRHVLRAGQHNGGGALCRGLLQSGIAAVGLSELHGGRVLSVGLLGGVVVSGRQLQSVLGQDGSDGLLDVSVGECHGFGHVLFGGVGGEHNALPCGIVLPDARSIVAMSTGYITRFSVSRTYRLAIRNFDD